MTHIKYFCNVLSIDFQLLCQASITVYNSGTLYTTGLNWIVS